MSPVYERLELEENGDNVMEYQCQNCLDGSCYKCIRKHKKCCELAKLLLEARDALPAISLASAKLHGINLTLADRIEDALEPWRIEDNA